MLDYTLMDLHQHIDNLSILNQSMLPIQHILLVQATQLTQLDMTITK